VARLESEKQLENRLSPPDFPLLFYLSLKAQAAPVADLLFSLPSVFSRAARFIGLESLNPNYARESANFRVTYPLTGFAAMLQYFRQWLSQQESFPPSH
jgi:hypothetical protein